MLTSEEEHQLLKAFNTKEGSYPTDKTIIDLFQEQVLKTPDATAVAHQGTSLTYKQLEERSNQLANYLISKGIRPNGLVGICIERSIEMMVGILGILKSGGAYVPIDPHHPKARIAHMLKDSRASIVISDAKNAEHLPVEEQVEVIKLEAGWDEKITRASTKRPKGIPSPLNIAYVIYTSGSTGTPKGTLIAHRSLTDYFYGITERTNIASCQSFAITSSFATDLGNTVIFTALLVGGVLHILSEDEAISAQRMAQMDIDCIKMVPSHWKTLQTKDSLFIPKK